MNAAISKENTADFEGFVRQASSQVILDLLA